MSIFDIFKKKEVKENEMESLGIRVTVLEAEVNKLSRLITKLETPVIPNNIITTDNKISRLKKIWNCNRKGRRLKEDPLFFKMFVEKIQLLKELLDTIGTKKMTRILDKDGKTLRNLKRISLLSIELLKILIDKEIKIDVIYRIATLEEKQIIKIIPMLQYKNHKRQKEILSKYKESIRNNTTIDNSFDNSVNNLPQPKWTVSTAVDFVQDQKGNGIGKKEIIKNAEAFYFLYKTYKVYSMVADKTGYCEATVKYYIDIMYLPDEVLKLIKDKQIQSIEIIRRMITLNTYYGKQTIIDAAHKMIGKDVHKSLRILRQAKKEGK